MFLWMNEMLPVTTVSIFFAGIGDKYQQFEGFLGLAEKPLIH